MSGKTSLIKIAKDGIWYKNPIFIQLLGLCPTLAISTSVKNAVGMGLSLIFVLICSNFVISLLKKFIPPQIRIVSYIVIVAGFVTMVDMTLKAYFPFLSKSLGIFIPLIVVNCIVLARAESFASKNKIVPSIMDGLAMGVGFMLALIAIAFVRMVLGAGTIFGFHIFGSSFQPALLMATPVGGFLTLGVLLALFQWINNKRRAK